MEITVLFKVMALEKPELQGPAPGQDPSPL